PAGLNLFASWIRLALPLDRTLFLRSRFRWLVTRRQPERLEGRFVGLLVEELTQTGIVGVLLVGRFDRLALFGEVIVGLRNVHRAHVADRLLGRAQHGGAFLHQFLRELNGRSLEPLGWNRIVDHADARGLLAVERLAEAGVIERVAR